MVLDMVTYYRDIEGNVARKEYFRDYTAFESGMRYREYTSGYVNRDNGNIKGVDLTIRKRFSNNFSLNLLYTLQFSRTTGSAYNTSYFSNIDPATGATFIPPDELNPIDSDRTHQVTTQFRYQFPEDFRVGTLANTILKNFQAYAVFRIMSGEPLIDRWMEGGITGYTLADDPALTRTGRGGSTKIGGVNYFRGRWFTNLDLRFTKSFSLGGTNRLSLFAEIFNVLNRKINRAYPSGYTYEGYDNVTGGVDLKWSEGLSPYQKARFNADFNGDGVLTVEEAALGEIGYDFMYDTMEKRVWGNAREIRIGADFRF